MTKVSKKDQSTIDESSNARVQKKFDMIYGENTEGKKEKTQTRDRNNLLLSDEDKTDANEAISIEFNMGSDEGMEFEERETKDAPNSHTSDNSGISLEFTTSEHSLVDLLGETVIPASSSDSTDAFSLDEVEDSSAIDTGFEINGEILDSLAQTEEDRTKLTEIFQLDTTNPNAKLSDIAIDKELLDNPSSAEMMDSEEAKAKIEMTIKDIVRPNPEDLAGKTQTSDAIASIEKHSAIDDIEDSVLEFRENTPTAGMKLPAGLQFSSSVAKEDSTQEYTREEEEEATRVGRFDSELNHSQLTTPQTGESTDVFNLASIEDEDEGMNFDEAPAIPEIESFTQVGPLQEMPRQRSSHADFSMSGIQNDLPRSSISESTDSLGYQSTIRALREEREDLLREIKGLKSEVKDRMQDQLSFKASLDETKIEISILRKRHLTEIEDYKYRLGISEEKRAIAEEKARHLEIQKEKMEQRVRIDYNQVKQREKELESKLELMSMDIDTQVQSREHKILELRRKIDALEFNIENASIKEQKTQEDKRRLDERLNKVMKMLRHSMNSLEDDYEATESHFHKDKNK